MEQDPQVFKMQHKFSSCFRSESDAQAHCRTRGNLSTLRKRQEALL
jgi:hypothetical protein